MIIFIESLGNKEDYEKIIVRVNNDKFYQKKGEIYVDGTQVVEFQYDIEDCIIFPQKGILVLLDSEKFPNDIRTNPEAGRNVFFVNFKGEIVWQIQRVYPVWISDPIKYRYSVVWYKDENTIAAGNFNGMEVLIDVNTGKIINEYLRRF